MNSNLPRKLIAVDLDQTLAHTLESLVMWHNDCYGTQFCVTDFNTYDYWKVWGGTKEETLLKMRDFYNSYHFDQIEPIRDFALEALKMLKRRHFTLVIVTSRQQFVAEKTKRFVDKHYPGIFESIYFCNLDLTDSEQLEYISKSKSMICQEIGADVLIDDSLEHALDCSSLGIDILLYDRKGKYTWNHQDPIQKKTSTGGLPPLTLTSSSKKLYHHRPTELSDCVHRMLNWRDIIAQFPKPTSPLRFCYFPDSFTEEEDSSVEENEQEDDLFDRPTSYYSYETVEVEMSEEEDEEEDQLWKGNRVWV
ncbi:hypothetical protein EDC94DRAFT_624582 [Helicostylum pulchrum]|uniref:Uncharacterized protein n=1 Tax=Helicostylum pulchrum TaxID=562976 RepID=A0ABP9YFZ5_9FUNG|nr:hypothetical protein EDC94DRAFT_624582 [Helicostylum pulchrum]